MKHKFKTELDYKLFIANQCILNIEDEYKTIKKIYDNAIDARDSIIYKKGDSLVTFKTGNSYDVLKDSMNYPSGSFRDNDLKMRILLSRLEFAMETINMYHPEADSQIEHLEKYVKLFEKKADEIMEE